MSKPSTDNGEARQDWRDIVLRHDAWGRLVLTDGQGQEHLVEPVRSCPLSAPRHGIALCAARGREILWIDDLDEVPPPYRQVLEEELARRQFVPVLKRIVTVSSPQEPSEWEVETDRGRTQFSMKSAEDVRMLASHGAIITDACGIRYLIPDVRALDAASRRLLQRYF